MLQSSPGPNERVWDTGRLDKCSWGGREGVNSNHKFCLLTPFHIPHSRGPKVVRKGLMQGDKGTKKCLIARALRHLQSSETS